MPEKLKEKKRRKAANPKIGSWKPPDEWQKAGSGNGLFGEGSHHKRQRASTWRRVRRDAWSLFSHSLHITPPGLLLRIELCSPKIHILKSQPPVLQHVSRFGDRVSKEVIKLKWCLSSEPKSPMTGILITRGNLGMHRGKPCKGKGSIWPSRCQGERPQNEINPADTLLCDFRPPKLWENTYLLCKPPSLCYCYASPSRLIEVPSLKPQMYMRGLLDVSLNKHASFLTLKQSDRRKWFKPPHASTGFCSQVSKGHDVSFRTTSKSL